MKPIDGFQEPDIDQKLWDEVRGGFELKYYRIDPAALEPTRSIPETIRDWL